MRNLKIPLFWILILVSVGLATEEVTHHHHKAKKHTLLYNDITQLYPESKTKEPEAQKLTNIEYPCKVAHCKECYPNDSMMCKACNSLYEMNSDRGECYEPSEFVQFGYRLLLSSAISFTFFLIMFLYYYYTKLHKSLTKNLADYIEDGPTS